MNWDETRYVLEKYYRARVYQIEQLYDRLAIKVRFDNGQQVVVDLRMIEELMYREKRGYIQNPYYVDPVAFKSDYTVSEFYGGIAPVEPPSCKSCGKNTKHSLDYHGFCPERAKQFWAKVRKLYWHRYLKNA